MALQPPLINLIGNEPADLWVHPARDGQEDAPVRRYGGIFAQHPLEAGEACRFGMRALDDLRQLARIADQHDVLCGATHGDHVGQPHLSGLVHEQPVERLHVLVAGEEPGGGADNMPSACGLVIAVGAADEAILGVAVILTTGLVDEVERDRQVRILQRAQAAHQHIANGLMAVRGDAHARALAHQRQDRPGGDIGLAGTGWPLDRQHGPVHRGHGGDGPRDRIGNGPQRAGGQARCRARQQIVDGRETALARPWIRPAPARPARHHRHHGCGPQ